MSEDCKKCLAHVHEFMPGYESEEDSQAAFASEVEKLAPGMFKVSREVEGQYMALRPGVKYKTPRVDFILQPLGKMKALGWDAIIAVECKSSSSKVGKAICQSIDYSHAVFRVGTANVCPDMLFLWPMPVPTHDIGSIMTQHRIGNVFQHKRSGDVVFKLGGVSVIRLSNDGTQVRSTQAFTAGRKLGSR